MRSVVSRTWLWLWLSVLGACNAAHTQGSTETGNPPVIDVNKVSLVVSSDGVEVIGEPGAVAPGGASVQLKVVGTDQVITGPSNSDGSFQIAVDAAADAVIEVSVSQGGQRSGTVIVTRGGAMVGDGGQATAGGGAQVDAGAMLSCTERTNRASQSISRAIDAAKTPCQSAADCASVPYNTVCTATCSDALIASADVSSIKDAVEAVNQGVCATFEADGCNVIIPPCTPPQPGSVACVAGRCGLASVECGACLNRQLEWGPTSNLRKSKISGCDQYSVEQSGMETCNAAVPHCGAAVVPDVTIEDLLRQLQHPDVTKAFAEGSTLGGAPAPGGMNERISVDGSSFVIAVCSAADCAEVPQGVRELSDMLDRIAAEIPCDGAACPPNARPVADVCTACGPAGGCVTAAQCAVVCSDDSACVDRGAGIGCSPRGICEATLCD